MTFRRYAIYYVPLPEADWAQAATVWLGWDVIAGRALDQPAIAGLDVAAITEAPRRYGLHATLKPPFRLRPGRSTDALLAACSELARSCARVECGQLQVSRMGRFFALCLRDTSPALTGLAAECVAQLDPFRAPPEAQDLERRRHPRLSPRQNAHLNRWGYPHVMEDFRFHLTLTSRLEKGLIPVVEAALSETLVPVLPERFAIADLALVGEDETGMFHLIERFALSSDIVSAGPHP